MSLRKILNRRPFRAAFALVGAGLLTTAAFAQGQDQPNPIDHHGATTDRPGYNHPGDKGMIDSPQGMTVTSDAEIMAQLIQLNKNEVKAAQMAEKKKVNGQVLDFAKMIRDDHEQNLEKTQQLGDKLGYSLTSQAGSVDRLEDQGEQDRNKIHSLKGDDFEHAFVAQMITAHRQALDMIDRWMDTAQDQELRDHLTATRQAVAKHLDEAERLQGSPGTETPGGDAPDSGTHSSSTHGRGR